MTAVRFTLNKSNASPLYYQLETAVRQEIHSGALKPGEQLPSESEFSSALGISRLTVRKALERLEFEGLVERYPGKGTFVRFPKIAKPISLFKGFCQMMKTFGLKVDTKYLDISTLRRPGETLREKLQLGPNDPVAVVERVRLVEGEPLVWQTAYLPERLVPGIAGCRSGDSLTEFLEEHYGLKVATFRAEIEPRSASSKEVSLLHVEECSPLLQIDSLSYDENQTPIRFSRSTYRGDRLKLVVEEGDITLTRG